jgi:hypothetical protein
MLDVEFSFAAIGFMDPLSAFLLIYYSVMILIVY